MLTNKDRAEVERVGGRMRARYRHLLVDEAKRRFEADREAERQRRELMVDRFTGDELIDEGAGDE
jgi:hypothetical protein